VIEPEMSPRICPRPERFKRHTKTVKSEKFVLIKVFLGLI
jgi:hypothetical protein